MLATQCNRFLSPSWKEQTIMVYSKQCWPHNLTAAWVPLQRSTSSWSTVTWNKEPFVLFLFGFLIYAIIFYLMTTGCFFSRVRRGLSSCEPKFPSPRPEKESGESSTKENHRQCSGQRDSVEDSRRTAGGQRDSEVFYTPTIQRLIEKFFVDATTFLNFPFDESTASL